MSDERGPFPETRLEVYRKVLAWLERENAPKIWPILDRPFVLTIMGGIVAGLLTTFWQTSEQHREVELTYQRAVTTEQLSLLKDLGSAYQSAGGIANSWFNRIIWIAEAKNEKTTIKRDRDIARWREQSAKLEEQFFTAPPIDNDLLRVEVMYKCPSVRESASEMILAWHEYENLFQVFNRAWNVSETLSDSRIKAADNSRKALLARLDQLNDQLLMRMAGEVSAGRDGTTACPS